MNELTLYNPQCQAITLNSDNYEDYIFDKINREALNRDNYEYTREHVMHIYFDMLSRGKCIPNIVDVISEVEEVNLGLLYDCADIYIEHEPFAQAELAKYSRDSLDFEYAIDSFQADFTEMYGSAVFDDNMEELVTTILIELGVSTTYDWDGEVYVSTDLSFLNGGAACFFNDCQNVLMPNFILAPLRQSGKFESYYSDDLLLKMSVYRQEKKYDGSCNT